MNFENWVKTYIGKGVDFDGACGVQCVDLARIFSKEVVGEDMGPTPTGYACGYFTNPTAQVKKLFTLIKNTPSFVPKKGDLMVWSSTLNCKAGHIAVCTGEGNTSYFYSYDYNWRGQNDGWTKVKHNYHCILGVLRPKNQKNITDTANTASSTGEKLMKFKVNATDGLNYRTAPNGTRAGTLPNKTVVNVVKGWGRTTGGYVWYKIKRNNKYYYVASQYLTYISG